MLSHLHILTLTHKGTALRDIGQVVSLIDEQAIGRADYLKDLCSRLLLDELLYTATCNRVLFLFSTRAKVSAAFKSKLLPQGCSDLVDQLDHYQGFEAVDHLFEVASSVDSLVVGERQILGQLRKSYKDCKKWGLIGDDLRVITQQMVVAAKAVYAETRIGEKSVSVVSLAMRRVMRKSPKPDSRVLLVGAGQTNALVAKFLRKYKLERVTVFNRSLESAQKLAGTFDGGRAFPLDQLKEYDEGFDILIVCTGALDPIITFRNWHNLLAGEDAKDKQVVDLAVPANVCPELVVSSQFDYIDVEQLRKEAEENLAFRSREIERAREVIGRHVEELDFIYRQRLIERVLKDIPVAVREIRSRAVDKVFSKELANLDAETQDLIDRMLGYVEKKYISLPMRKAREELISHDQQQNKRAS
ncbi:MAG: glutamyl-tRNA reductase [Bacteroidota bacterium]